MMKRRWQKAKHSRAQGRMRRSAWHAEKFSANIHPYREKISMTFQNYMCVFGWLNEKRSSLNISMAYMHLTYCKRIHRTKTNKRSLPNRTNTKTCSHIQLKIWENVSIHDINTKYAINYLSQFRSLTIDVVCKKFLIISKVPCVGVSA